MIYATTVCTYVEIMQARNTENISGISKQCNSATIIETALDI